MSETLTSRTGLNVSKTGPQWKRFSYLGSWSGAHHGEEVLTKYFLSQICPLALGILISEFYDFCFSEALVTFLRSHRKLILAEDFIVHVEEF